jgi:hypothetical protein
MSVYLQVTVTAISLCWMFSAACIIKMGVKKKNSRHMCGSRSVETMPFDLMSIKWLSKQWDSSHIIPHRTNKAVPLSVKAGADKSRPLNEDRQQSAELLHSIKSVMCCFSVKQQTVRNVRAGEGARQRRPCSQPSSVLSRRLPCFSPD